MTGLKRDRIPTPRDDPTRSLEERSYMVELGQRIRALREERGLTQHSLARSAGVATDMVSRLENGHYQSPGLRTLFRVAEGLGLSVAQLLPDAPGKSASPEAALRARLGVLARRASREEVELIVELAATVLQRRREPGSR